MKNSTTITAIHAAGVKANNSRRALLARHGINSAIPAGMAPVLIREELERIDKIIAESSAVTGLT